MFNIKEEVFLLRVGIYKLVKIIHVADQDILEQIINVRVRVFLESNYPFEGFIGKFGDI